MAIIRYVVYKFGQIQLTDSEARMSTAGVNHFTGVSSATFHRIGTARHCSDQLSGVFHSYSLGRNTAMPERIHARLWYAFLVITELLLLPRLHCYDRLQSCEITYTVRPPCRRCGDRARVR